MFFNKSQNNTQGKPPTLGSTQEHLEIDQIKDDILIMKDGSLRAVLMVSSINMQLLASEEQEIIIASYQNILNSVEFPLQILIQSRRVDLNNYITSLESAMNNQTNTLLKDQTEDYIYFLQDILDSVNVMDKKFFVIVPYYPSVIEAASGGVLSTLGLKKKTEAESHKVESYEQNRRYLFQRVDMVVSLLRELRLTVTQLPTQALVELFYVCYNPETVGYEHIKNLESLGTKYITAREAAEKQM